MSIYSVFKELGDKKKNQPSSADWSTHHPPRQVFFNDALLEVLVEDEYNSQGFQVNHGQKTHHIIQGY